jgi:hypothetical protein
MGITKQKDEMVSPKKKNKKKKKKKKKRLSVCGYERKKEEANDEMVKRQKKNKKKLGFSINFPHVRSTCKGVC